MRHEDTQDEPEEIIMSALIFSSTCIHTFNIRLSVYWYGTLCVELNYKQDI